MTATTLLALAICLLCGSSTSAFSVNKNPTLPSSIRPNTQLHLDQNVIQGAGVAIAGLAAGLGLVYFTENQSVKGGLSEDMSTRIAGSLMEDVEMSSVSDLGGLTSQLENALKESSSDLKEEFELSEEDKKRIAEELDDGW